MDKEKGITIISLVITIIIMIILAGVAIKVGLDAVEKAKVEDIKTNMISIKTKAAIIAEKNSFDSSSQNLIGLTLADKGSFVISTQLQSVLDTQENGTAKYTKCYIWTQDDLKSQGLNTIKVDENKFYIVDYSTGEVFYSLGYNGEYTLTDLK